MTLAALLARYQLAQANYNKFKLADDLAEMNRLYDKMIERERSLVENNKLLVEALRNIKDYRTDMSAEIAERSMRFYAEMAFEDIGKDL